jgi:hypothetical protein
MQTFNIRLEEEVQIKIRMKAIKKVTVAIKIRRKSKRQNMRLKVRQRKIVLISRLGNEIIIIICFGLIFNVKINMG